MQVYMLPYCRNFKCGNSRRLLTVKPAFLPQPYRVCTLVILSQFVHFVHLLSVHVNHNLNPLFLNMTIPLPQKISLVLPHLWSLSVKMDQSKARPESIVDLVLFGCGAFRRRQIRPVQLDWLRSTNLSNIRPAWLRSFNRWNPGYTLVCILNGQTVSAHIVSLS